MTFEKEVQEMTLYQAANILRNEGTELDSDYAAQLEAMAAELRAV